MDIRDRLLDHYRWLRRYGINDSHSGNASVRDAETIWVTPTGACADTLTVADLVPCPPAGPPPQGASLDAALHLAVYRRNPEVGAVLHSHGPHTVALTLNGEDYRPVDFEGQLYFPRVPVLDIPYGDYLERAPEAVAAALAENPVAVVRGHGVYARGEDLDRAYKWTCSLEHSARTDFIARNAC